MKRQFLRPSSSSSRRPFLRPSRYRSRYRPARTARQSYDNGVSPGHTPVYRALTFSVIAVILAVGVLFSIALLLEQDVVGFVFCLGVIVFWILIRKTSWIAGITLIIVSFYTAIGIFREEHIPLYVAAFLLSFVAWNLSLLTSRISRVENRPEEKRMLISYLIRLGEVTAVSGTLTAIGILVDMRINFWIILLLVLFAVWMVSRLLRAHR